MTVTTASRQHPARERFQAFPATSPVRRLRLRAELPGGTDRGRLERALAALAVTYPDLLGPGFTVESVTADRPGSDAVLAAFEEDAAPAPRALVVGTGDAVRLALVLDRTLVDHRTAGLLLERLAALFDDGSPGEYEPAPDGAEEVRLPSEMLSEVRTELADVPLDVLLPRRAHAPAASRFSRFSFALPQDALAAVDRLCRERRLTREAVLVAAYQALLHRYSRQGRFLLGVELDRPDAAARRGATADLVPLAAEFTRASTLGTAAPAAADALDRSARRPAVPLPVLAELLGRPLSAAAPGLFGTVFALRPPLPRPVGTAAWQWEESPEAAVDCDLELTVHLDGDASEGRACFRYRAGVFDDGVAEQLARHYVRLLEAGAREPDTPLHRLPMLDEDDRGLLLDRWSGAADPWQPVEPLYRTVEHHARRTPGAPAVAAADAELSYGELNGRANRLARRLAELGVGHGDVVALCADRSAAWLTAFLAVHKLGAIVFPVDPRTPPLRLAAAFETITPRLLVHAPGLELPETSVPALPLDGVSAGAGEAGPEAEADPDHEVSLDDLAYIMLTSGSTGTPKAVFGQHRVIAHIGAGFAGLTRLTPDERASWMTPTGFGTTIAELSQPLVAGGCLVAVPGDLLTAPDALAAWLLEQRIAVTFAVTQVGSALQELPWPADTPLRILMMGGEKVHQWGPADLPFEVAVGYGCHEALFVTSPLHPWERRVTAATATPQDRLSPPPIGRPNPGVRLQILGDEGELMSPGAVGEIWFESPEGALGYWRDPALTADKYRPDPFGPPGSRHYRTGDLGRYRPDGLLEHHGRVDDMVKIRGCRVELGEVESALLVHPRVREAAVVPVRAGMGEATLVACVVLDGAVDPAELRGHLTARLPDYMVPAAFVPVDELPRTINKKVDRAALPPHDWAARRVRAQYRAPAEGLESTIAAVWAEVLGEERFGADDSFLDMGGTSLHAGRLLTRLRGVVGQQISLRDIFLFPTPAGLAQLLASRTPEPEAAPLPRLTRRQRR
ncbi:amino acid adenylation domain-containing protein [Streptosporangium becharense]|uniref:Amino acid adenylation domain-containing protein n=1 Tax=Streptosporangium becharense TaxID=1816182 RepID=A0A7W9ILT7_9ACTN|nr:amino acid adenylation domain-containing protein [Streptosporangium becharense]MBB2910382.1 amino acid adenylation domain-containing protein [Streptosporangium becharense]MBB5823125.1 amino acid adenylation domain-containing protein [Streptosporangium becharense]